MRYRLWFESSNEHLVRREKFLAEITKPAPYQGDLVTAKLLVAGLKGELSRGVVLGELKKWKNQDGEERSFVRIDNHQTGRHILTPFRLEKVLARERIPIDQRTDFKRTELDGENIEDIFQIYKKELASSDSRPFVLAQQDASL